MLDFETIKRLKIKLLTLREELTALDESKESAADNITLDQSRVGRLSRMDALAAAAMGAETQRRRALQLKMITEALHRIDDDSYGECLECFEMINADRLELNPAVPLCIQCATKAENNVV